ncbi:AbrB/MazE/SpoVT family DNA-binding domain-containing protein [Sphingomonas sp. PL-96]|uniref:AbrB/MazE/SpoVT family DNA-binding domain-containing protein n=1 Tax=Sphingomonas sp. PL-96 TaxID=2887201 RepID=UPI001E613CCA|nr:AbrB/MazE/SpoVT family DNA-binding domain-containing protein [Sphingomonas sp. PL-96]MCC2977586.1 AbrB/MazE/SpoVT family DNA-binding domain-containing protein [Sphingomonas sp. PL-96]
MGAHTRISEKGQVVVPKAARDRLGWIPGTELEIVETTDAITLRPRRSGGRLGVEEAISRLRQLYQHEGPPVATDMLSWSPDVDDDPA